MPELPEIETIRLQLQSKIIGMRISYIQINWKSAFIGEKDAVIGAKINKLRHFSKMIVMDLDNHKSLAIHLRMSGKLIYKEANKLKQTQKDNSLKIDYEKDRHTHIIFYFEKSNKLFFNDYRKFGRIAVVATDEVLNLPYIKNLGLEPFRNLDFEKFTGVLFRYGRPIKLLLMDQKRIAGVGNIYANEALFCAGVAPHHRARDLVREHSKKAKRLYDCLLQVLKKGLKYQGASQNAYLDAYGQEGKMQEHFLIYGKERQMCPNKCGGKIRKMKLGGRGTYFCPRCQR